MKRARVGMETTEVGIAFQSASDDAEERAKARAVPHGRCRSRLRGLINPAERNVALGIEPDLLALALGERAGNPGRCAD